jgi:WhiB family redox-sensing transcriptional regulator
MAGMRGSSANRFARPLDWRDRAACLAEDPELFFPVGSTGPAAQQIALAKAVCARCPVVESCLSWALYVGEQEGVWGGTSPDERARLLRARPLDQAVASSGLT